MFTCGGVTDWTAVLRLQLCTAKAAMMRVNQGCFLAVNPHHKDTFDVLKTHQAGFRG